MNGRNVRMRLVCSAFICLLTGCVFAGSGTGNYGPFPFPSALSNTLAGALGEDTFTITIVNQDDGEDLGEGEAEFHIVTIESLRGGRAVQLAQLILLPCQTQVYVANCADRRINVRLESPGPLQPAVTRPVGGGEPCTDRTFYILRLLKPDDVEFNTWDLRQTNDIPRCGA